MRVEEAKAKADEAAREQDAAIQDVVRSARAFLDSGVLDSMRRLLDSKLLQRGGNPAEIAELREIIDGLGGELRDAVKRKMDSDNALLGALGDLTRAS